MAHVSDRPRGRSMSLSFPNCVPGRRARPAPTAPSGNIDCGQGVNADARLSYRYPFLRCAAPTPSKRKPSMKIHEYQAKEILRKHGVATPRGIACFSVDEAVAAAHKLGGAVWVVKAQIHAGGRGKGGGVKLARSIDEVRRYAGEILGMMLKTHQTGPQGQKVRRLLIEEGADIKTELYVALVVDRGTQRVCLMASEEGGMDIEEVAAKTPEKIHKVFI